jgi:hypothetical protein
MKLPLNRAPLMPLSKRSHFVERSDLVDHRAPFGFQIVGDRVAKPWVGDIMGGPGRHRPIAAAKLVRALRPRLDEGQPSLDRRFDRLIIADLEMEVGHFLDRSPIAAVKRIFADQVERPRDRHSVAHREDEQHPLGHPLAEQ